MTPGRGMISISVDKMHVMSLLVDEGLKVYPTYCYHCNCNIFLERDGLSEEEAEAHICNFISQ